MRCRAAGNVRRMNLRNGAVARGGIIDAGKVYNK
jgi:hypothetical protein